jgi:signal transduction histidine kinase
MVGFAATLAVIAFIAAVSTLLLHDVITQKDLVIYDYGQDLILTERLRYLAEKKVSLIRGYYITHEQSFLDEIPVQTQQFNDIVHQLLQTATPEETANLNDLTELFRGYHKANAEVLDHLKKGEADAAILNELARKVRPFRQAFQAKLAKIVKSDSDKLDRAKQDSLRISHRSFVLIAVIAATALTLAAILAFMLGRTLNNLYQSAVRATRLREEVLGIVAHDLKNPITAIQLNSRLLMRAAKSADSPKDVGRLMERIERVTHQMQRLIDDLLVADKIESGMFAINCQIENVSLLLSDAAQAARALAQQKQIKFETRFSPNLGELVCDRERLMQVLSNLLGNAIKFTPEKGVVVFEVIGLNDDILFVVKDTGPGITPKQMPHLFERRWQAQASAQKGNGLGLFIAKSIVKAHRGKITVESTPDEGTIFRVEIPRGLNSQAWRVSEKATVATPSVN